MSRPPVALLLSLAIAGCGGRDENGGKPDAGRDAAVILDGSGGILDGSVVPDAVIVPDLNICPIYDPSGGSDPSGAKCTLTDDKCDYFEAYCYCHDTWHCCSTGQPVQCPLTQPTPGDPCCNNFVFPNCDYDCINGQAPTCKCNFYQWQCTISAC